MSKTRFHWFYFPEEITYGRVVFTKTLVRSEQTALRDATLFRNSVSDDVCLYFDNGDASYVAYHHEQKTYEITDIDSGARASSNSLDSATARRA